MGEIRAFTAEQVCHLTGLSQRQLAYWDKTRFFSPTHIRGPRQPYSRIYSFRDLVGLRAIAVLRNKHKVALQELRDVGKWLAEDSDSSWATTTFLGLSRNRGQWEV